jgi:adenylate kinase family enzyme
VVVGGISGSGKSTLARELARRTGAAYVELDALFHKPGWEPSTDEEFAAKITAALDAAGERWVVDGNYTRMRDLVWSRATTFVWLDYPFGVATWRAVKRTARRLATREALWHGNRERFSNLFDKGHPIWWSMSQYRGSRARYEQAVRDPRWAHLGVVRIRDGAGLRELLRYAARP